ncbi:MAG TPA: 5-formyltetrahydrofolate cyclo-ligase, partial [Epulopiscium sp.]|nr:5-formyltetrahydrofolate cyclo-ligase [Candidatus Epulonipiscium sp.]
SLLEPKADPSSKIIPDADTLMIVPGLAFDKDLYRTGYGGGFYDKYIAKYPSLKTIGVCYDFQVVDSIPRDEYDQAVEILVTEVDEE